MVFDHFAAAEVNDFVYRFRAAEQSGADNRFILIPTDLVAANSLQSALSGNVRTIHVDPLQLDDAIAENQILSAASGPSPGLMPVASPTNAEVFDSEKHWLRGGLPESLAADSDNASLVWRRQLLSDLLARDYSSWDVPRALRVPDILRWIANQNGGEFDDNSCPIEIAKRSELRSAIHVLDKLGVIRRLSNFPVGSNSSFGKKQKVYIRDSGILHALLGIETIAQLRAHQKIGESWEGYAIEALISTTADACTPQFYRIKGDDGVTHEIDLVLDFQPKRNELVAIECKTSPDAGARPGFYRGCEAIGATRRFIVHSGRNPSQDGLVARLDLPTALRQVAEIVAR